MKKFVCQVCGYIYEGENPPAACPVCKAPASKFVEQKEEKTEWADQHFVGVAKDVDPEIVEGLRQNFEGECSEVGMYLAMARVAHREGYPERSGTRCKVRRTAGRSRNRFHQEESGNAGCCGKRCLCRQEGSGSKGEGSESGCHSRYCSRNGKGRSKTRLCICRSAEAVFRRISNELYH